MSEELPTGFGDLDRDELYRTAVADFAVDVDKEANADVIRAALLESGVEWAQYVEMHPEVAPEPPVKETKAAKKAAAAKVVAPKPAKEEVVVQQPLPASQPWLIKMVRENLLYETRGHRFTQEHPYALVDAEDAQFILDKEDGFRQAYPEELQEYYS